MIFRKSIILALVLSVFIIIVTLISIEHPLYIHAKTFAIESELVTPQYIIKDISDITERDHIQGNPDGEIVLIEYSDLTCVFCALMRDVFKQLEREYSNVRLVYRHFYPTQSKSALSLAVKAECVASLSNDKTFFNYINKIYENQGNLNDTLTTQYAAEVGVNLSQLKECVEKEETLEHILKQSEEIEMLGARGTPYILFVQNNQPQRALYALPYDSFVEVLIEEVGIDSLIADEV